MKHKVKVIALVMVRELLHPGLRKSWIPLSASVY